MSFCVSIDKTLTQNSRPTINMSLGTNRANVDLGKRKIQRALRIHGVKVGILLYFVGLLLFKSLIICQYIVELFLTCTYNNTQFLAACYLLKSYVECVKAKEANFNWSKLYPFTLLYHF